MTATTGEVLEDFMHRGQWCRRYVDGWVVTLTAANMETGDITDIQCHLDPDLDAEAVRGWIDRCRWNTVEVPAKANA